jgi:hypothetical protein
VFFSFIILPIGVKIRLISDFSEETMQERKEYYSVERKKEKNHQSRILYLDKFSIKSKKEIFLRQAKIEEICCQ